MIIIIAVITSLTLQYCSKSLRELYYNSNHGHVEIRIILYYHSLGALLRLPAACTRKKKTNNNIRLFKATTIKVMPTVF